MAQNYSDINIILERSPTEIELFWLNKTRGFSDFQLYCLTILILLVVYPLANLPYLILDYLKLPFFEKYRMQSNSYNSPTATWQCLKDVLWTMVVTVGPLQFLSYPFFKLAGITASLPLPSLPLILLQLLVFFLIEDYGNYWLHRSMHYGWLYDNIHYKHHEYSTPMGVAASYAHWMEILVLGIPSFVGPAIVQCHVVTMWLWIVARTLEAIETHSGYDFPWNPAKLIPFYGGSEYHDYHHLVGGQSKGNFASVFTYCDWLYGTDKGFRYKKALKAKGKKSD